MQLTAVNIYVGEWGGELRGKYICRGVGWGVEG